MLNVYTNNGVEAIEDIDPSVRPQVEAAENILSQKRSSQGEIIVTLFESCNLTCKFCNQDHNSDIGMNNIMGKFDDIIKSITLLKKMRKETFSIHFMGGELFQDGFPNSLYEDYDRLVRRLHGWAQAEGETLSYTFVSNLVHMNTARVKQLLDGLRGDQIDVDLGTSYDPAMRFNTTNLAIFGRNLEIYKSYIGVVNVILTAPNIRKFLNRDIPHFDYIYENFDVYFDYYTPEDNWEIMSPKDHEIRDMYVWLIDNYPLSHPVRGFSENESNNMSCQSTYTIMPDGKAGRCTILINSWQKKQAPKTAGEIEYEFISKMDCLSCEFFSRCGLGCYLQQHFNGPNRTMNDCWMKDVHRRIDEVKNVR